MSGVAGGWITFLLFNVSSIGGLSFLFSLVVRFFARGLALIALSVLPALCVLLVLAGTGMAKSDFNIWFVSPLVLCAAIVAGGWIVIDKVQVLRG